MKHNRSMGDEKSEYKNFAAGQRAVADASLEQAKKAIEHAVATFEMGKELVASVKETLAQTRLTIEEVKLSAKGAISKIRENPAPFLAAIAPGAIGVYLLVEQWRRPKTSEDLTVATVSK